METALNITDNLRNLSGPGGNVTNSTQYAYTYDDIRSANVPSAILLLEKWSPILWYVIGFPGNILAFIIWLQPRMRQSSGYYLVALALADLVFLSLNVVYYLYMTWYVPVLDVPGVCEVYPVFYYASQYLSPLFVLGFTVERYISICFPFQRHKYCTTRRALMVVLLLCFNALVLSAIQGYIFQYVDFGEGFGICTIRSSAMKGGMLSLRQLWSFFTEILIFGFVPIAILTINIRVLFEIRKLGHFEEQRLSLRNDQPRPNRMSWVTKTLLTVSFYLIATTLPVTVVFLLLPAFPEGREMSPTEASADAMWQRHFFYESVKSVIQVYGMSRYSFNFYIYLYTGPNFRQELKKLFHRICPAYAASNADRF